MEPFLPFLIALLAMLALIVVIASPRLMRTRRERRQRRAEQAIIDAAMPRMRWRMEAVRDPSILPRPEPPYVPSIPGALALHPIPSVATATTTRRRVWRDASAGLVAFAALGLVVVLALPAVGQPAPQPTSAPPDAAAAASQAPTDAATLPAIALAPSPLPTRVEIVLPTEVPTPTLPVTATPRPTERVTAARAAPRATPRPTPKPTPKPTAKPKPKPTPIPDPIARFSCSFTGELSVAFDSTSRYASRYAWNFDGDGTSSAADPTHTFSGSGGYRVSLTVTNASGSDTATKFIDLDARTGCS